MELDEIRGCLVRALEDADVPAQSAWSERQFTGLDGGIVAVAIRGCEGYAGGLGDYLGAWYDESTTQWLERYGRRMKLTFGLDIYAPETVGAAGCQTLFDQLAEVLQLGLPAGLRVGELRRGEVEFDRSLRLFHCPVEAQCEAFLYLTADETAEILFVEVKGEMT